MKKSKAQDIDLFYIGEEEKEKKKKKNKKVAGKAKPATKKTENEQSENKEIFSFDDEIVIGVTKIEDKQKKKEKNNKKKKDTKTKKEKVPKNNKDKKENTKNQEQSAKQQNVKSKKTSAKQRNTNTNNQQPTTKHKTQKSQTPNTNKKTNKIATIAKYSFLIVLLLGSIIYFMLSPVFNIKQITINNNQIVSNEEIINLSGIALEENTFKLRLGQVEKNIKENAYVESVKIRRKLPSEIQIDVTERTATYMLEFVNSMVYLSNQGYMLEVTENKIEAPIITGYETPTEEIKAGNRLCEADLNKLETVLKIMETAKNYEIGNLITKIGIADKNNYTLFLEGEKKTVYLGDASNINTRIMYLKQIIELEKGIESEIFINGDINKDDVYTREKV